MLLIYTVQFSIIADNFQANKPDYAKYTHGR